MARLLTVLLLLLALVGCTRLARVDYPATPVGEAVRKFYEKGDGAGGLVLVDLDVKANPAGVGEFRALTLAILRQDFSSDRALQLASLLTNKDEAVAATAAEYRALVPALVKGLNRPNVQEDMTRWTAVGSALLLARMGPEATAGSGEAVGKRFNSPRTPILGESAEAWTLYWLGGILPGYGKEGVAALVQGLSNKETSVRHLALEGLMVAASGKPLMGERAETWQLSAARREEARQAAVEVGKSPAVRERLVAFLKEAENKDAAEEAMKALGIAVPATRP